MNDLQKFVDETFKMMTGLGDMKVAEAIFLGAVDNASQTLANPIHKDNKKLMREVLSHAYNGQNIIKMCAHLPRDSKAEKYASELCMLAHAIDCLVCPLETV